jgi:hypothetical protein
LVLVPSKLSFLTIWRTHPPADPFGYFCARYPGPIVQWIE